MHAKALMVTLLVSLLPTASQATNLMYMPFETVVSDAIRAGRLDGSVKFYLAGNRLDGPAHVLQANVSAFNETNGFTLSDNDSCEVAVQAVLVSLQNAAKHAGANAVTNIVSNYDQRVRKDLNTYECQAGVFKTGVALRGDLARVQ